MEFNKYRSIKTIKNGKLSFVLSIAVAACLIVIIKVYFNSKLSDENKTNSVHPAIKKNVALAAVPQNVESRNDTKIKNINGLWDGPVLFHEPVKRPIHLILIEKSTQTLYLYLYDGKYRLIKKYFCATGENQGKKQAEGDEKTPEGIYFNNKTYRDRKISVFGDRAFGLNYPDIFDNLGGNRGSGIFLHGSDRKITPYSTNGCLALENADIADLDKRVSIKQTPVIIAERLSYRFSGVKRNLTELIPFIKKTLIPQKYTGMAADYDGMTVLGFKDRVVATTKVGIKTSREIYATSRLYFASPGNTFLVLLKREWDEEEKKVITTQKAIAGKVPAKAAAEMLTRREKTVRGRVESWRRAWERKRLDEYINHYHPAFTSKGKNRSQWRVYKERLNKRTRNISVKISGVRVEFDGQKALAYFRQHYRSDTFRSSSYKILEFKKKGGKWKIYRENSTGRKPVDWPAA